MDAWEQEAWQQAVRARDALEGLAAQSHVVFVVGPTLAAAIDLAGAVARRLERVVDDVRRRAADLDRRVGAGDA